MKKTFTLFTAAIVAATFATSATAQTILAGGFGTDGLGVANGDTYTKTGTLGSGGFPFVSAARDGSAFYTTGSGKLYFINAAATSFIDSMSVNLKRISSLNESNMLFGNTSSALVRINTATKSVVDSIVLGALWEITERPNAKEVWVTDSGKVHAVDYTSTLSQTTIQVASSPYDNSKIAFTPGGSMGYKSASSSKMLYKINPSTKTVVDSVSTAPYGFSNMVVSDDSSKLFVCNNTNNTIRVYNTATLTVIDSISCSMVPFNIYRHPTKAELWVVHHFSDSVSVYNSHTKALIAAFKISGSPWYLAFSSASSSAVPGISAAPKSIIYPNPVSDNISVEAPVTGCQVSILSISGRVVRTWKMSGMKQSVDVADLLPGNYILRITGSDLTENLMFIKN